MNLLSHLLLGSALLTLGSAAGRLASACAPVGLERALAAVTFAAAFAVLEAVMLGFVGASGSAPALLIGVGAAWLLARILLPAPAVSFSEEVASGVRKLSPTERAAAGAMAGVGMGWAIWSLRRAQLGVDAIYYHTPEVIGWLHAGTTGSAEVVNPLLPVENYPLVNEVLFAWAAGIAPSFAVFSVWPVAAGAILLAATWLGFRALAVPRRVRILALGSVAAIPLVTNQLLGPTNDLPAVAWLVTAASLAACARARPTLLLPAVVAVGLAAGTKTTTLPVAVFVFVASGWALRDTVRELGRPALTGALLVAGAVGGFWYLRDLLVHGSPFWPWSATPWGDPVPEALARLFPNFLSRPVATLDGRVGQYADATGGGLILVSVALLLAATARRARWVMLLGAVVLGSLLLWSVAPSTGLAEERALDASVSQMRYLLPATVIAVLALVLVAARGGKRRSVALGALALAIIAGLGATYVRDSAYALIPSPKVLGACLAVGAVAGVALATTFRSARSASFSVSITVLVLAVGFGLLAPGFGVRHGRTLEFDAGLAAFLSTVPDFRDGDEPVFMGPVLSGVLAGDELQHDVRLIETGASCSSVERHRRGGWVVLREDPILRREIGYRVGSCLVGAEPLAVVDGYSVYAPTG